MSLLAPYTLGTLHLQNRVVLAPMTRSRAIGGDPNALMAEYYGQRAGAGLIITEGTAPSASGMGYARIPGAYSESQVEGWKGVVDAAHAGGAKIFLQLMHTGRISHALNLPDGAEVIAPSAVQAASTMWTDQEGPLDHPTPRALETDEVHRVIAEYATAAENALRAGFDGVELHGANGYLIEQFLNVATNRRDDRYGGDLTNRNRFAIEVAEAVADAIGGERTAIRLSPYNTFNDMDGDYLGVFDQYVALASALRPLGLAYLHLTKYPAVGEPMTRALRAAFGGPIMVNGSIGDRAQAQSLIDAGVTDLVSFGTAFLANPDLPRRLAEDIPLNDVDAATFYTEGAEGYTDYPAA